MKVIDKIDYFIPVELRCNHILLSKARIIVASGILLLVLMITLVIPPAIFNQPAGIIVFDLIITILFISTLVVIKKFGSVQISGLIIMLAGYSLITVGVFRGGGLYASVMTSYSMVILYAFLLTGFRSGMIWIGITFATIFCIKLMSVNGFDFGPVVEDPQPVITISTLLANASIIAVLFELTSVSNAKKFEQERNQSINTADQQKKLLDDAGSVMQAAAEGDLSKEITVDVHGELEQLKTKINNTLKMLSTTLEKVAVDSIKIQTAAVEMNNASQSMAEGTTEQAASLEEISSSMSEIDNVAKRNRDNSEQAQQLSNQTMQEISNSNKQMEAMLISMKQIDKTSRDVSKVIKVIDEIAFQTNLLALNAAVEAARAGKYGKGFAVVAEEVRNLASRSAEAAKNTTELIESSINEVDSGVRNADQTAEILKGFVSSIEKVNEFVKEIYASSQEQSSGVNEIGRGLTQVNEVVQRHSSIAEETASTSVELKQHSDVLQEMMSRFRLSTTSDTADSEQSYFSSRKLEVKQTVARKVLLDNPEGFPKMDRSPILDDNEFG